MDWLKRSHCPFPLGWYVAVLDFFMLYHAQSCSTTRDSFPDLNRSLEVRHNGKSSDLSISYLTTVSAVLLGVGTDAIG